MMMQFGCRSCFIPCRARVLCDNELCVHTGAGSGPNRSEGTGAFPSLSPATSLLLWGPGTTGPVVLFVALDRE